MKRTTLLLFLAAAAIPAAASAFVRTPIHPSLPHTCLYWEDRTIEWSPAAELGGELGRERTLDAVRRSFAEWERQSCTDLDFVEAGPAARSVGYQSQGRNDNVVLFRDRLCSDVVPPSDPCHSHGDCADVHDCWPFPTELIAVTTTTFSDCTGQIVDADIEFNAASFRFTDVDGEGCRERDEEGCVDTDLRNTMVHEIGHLIGLDHTPVREATMYASAPRGETNKRSLAPDDIEGLCSIYPAGAPTSTCQPAKPLAECRRRTSDGESGGCASGGAGLALLGLVPAATWAWRRRSR